MEARPKRKPQDRPSRKLRSLRRKLSKTDEMAARPIESNAGAIRDRGLQRGFRPSLADCVSVGLLGAALVGGVSDLLPATAPFGIAVLAYVLLRIAVDAGAEC